MTLKTKWRQLLLKRRKAISQERREEAAHLCLKLLDLRGQVLSFSPIGSEINLTPLNDLLKKEGRLVLIPYKVEYLPHLCNKEISHILVPALGFDKEMYRIGYGKGYYDRLLAHFPTIPTIGVGFKEQLCETLLPKDPWDVPVQKLYRS